MVTVNHSQAITATGALRRDSEYKGLSTDEKPMDAVINALFLELDTGEYYFFTGTGWSKVGGAAS